MRRLLCLLLAVLAMPFPLAAQGTPPLVITSAQPDVDSGTLTIAGSGFGARPFVTMDLVPLTVQLAMDQRIVAAVPVGMIPPGTYLLTVTRGPQAGDTASFQVRLGAETPQAEALQRGTPQNASPVSPGGAGPAAPAGASTAGGGLPGGADPAARVGDRTITMADVDREWQRTDPVGFLAASRQLYEARRKIVNDLVNNELLAREAASRKISVEALLAEELPKRTIPLPDTSLTALYQSLGSRSRGASLDQLRPALREWLSRKVEPELARMTYLEELTKVSTRADVLMQAPQVRVERAADDPYLGPDTAPVEVVIFGDFGNSAYARYALTLPRVRDMFGARARFVFKHFPSNDPASIQAAEAAACANQQGRFWPFHDTLLGSAGALDAARFKAVATQVALDRTTFDTCLDGSQMRPRIGRALEEAARYDLPGTPSILVNGRLAPEPPAFLPAFEYFKRLVEEELARQSGSAR